MTRSFSVLFGTRSLTLYCQRCKRVKEWHRTCQMPGVGTVSVPVTSRLISGKQPLWTPVASGFLLGETVTPSSDRCWIKWVKKCQGLRRGIRLELVPKEVWEPTMVQHLCLALGSNPSHRLCLKEPTGGRGNHIQSCLHLAQGQRGDTSPYPEGGEPGRLSWVLKEE